MSYRSGEQQALRALGLEKVALDGHGYGQTFAGPRTLREAGQQAGVAGLMGAYTVGALSGSGAAGAALRYPSPAMAQFANVPRQLGSKVFSAGKLGLNAARELSKVPSRTAADVRTTLQQVFDKNR